MSKKIKIYLANGLFNAADRLLNEVIYKELLKVNGIEVYAPQFNLAINDKKKSAGSKPIYEGDTAKLQ
ncbi:MAG: nucleoside 2-deoxyribosyltransferase [Mycoplasmoidaceae bacterium]|nr:nucleoside 2-deoxyribosyltransferase [Mycoplasmoidaceae bacterium]